MTQYAEHKSKWKLVASKAKKLLKNMLNLENNDAIDNLMEQFKLGDLVQPTVLK